MAKKPQRLLLTTILLTVLLISSAYAMLTPSAHAQEITAKTKALTVINQVAGVDLTKYTANATLDVNGSYLGLLPTENIRYTLSSAGSQIKMLATFTNGSLQMIDVLENVGSPRMTAPAASVARMAQAFLLNYQSYSANSFYGQLASMLNQAAPTQNSTTTIGNLNFNITTTTGNSSLGNSTTFTWSYTSNGVDADCKCVSISYENSFLKDFIDTWNLYPIGSTTVNLSEQQAETIAMSNAKTYSWTVGSGNETHLINKFNVTEPKVEQLVFCEVAMGLMRVAVIR
jgi:hypothetical protein